MLTTPIRLSDCGDCLVLDDNPGDRYTIVIEPGTYLVITAGVHATSPGAAFTHPAIAATRKRIHEFKHDLPTGRKYWTSRPGIDHDFVIRRTVVILLPKKGYSYIPATIDNVPVTFDASGGTANGGWTDWLPTHIHIGVGHPVRDLKRFAAVAVRGTSLEPLPGTLLDAEGEQRWARLVAHTSPALKHQLYFLIASGQRPIVHLATQYDYQQYKSGPAVQVDFGGRTPTRPTGLILELRGARVFAKLSHIDWYATAQANRLPLDAAPPIPTEAPACPAPGCSHLPLDCPPSET